MTVEAEVASMLTEAGWAQSVDRSGGPLSFTRREGPFWVINGRPNGVDDHVGVAGPGAEFDRPLDLTRAMIERAKAVQRPAVIAAPPPAPIIERVEVLVEVIREVERIVTVTDTAALDEMRARAEAAERALAAPKEPVPVGNTLPEDDPDAGGDSENEADEVMATITLNGERHEIRTSDTLLLTAALVRGLNGETAHITLASGANLELTLSDVEAICAQLTEKKT